MTSHFHALLIFMGSFWFIPVIVALAIFSITRLIVEDSIADPIRNKFFDKFPHEGYTSRKKPKRGSASPISGGLFLTTKGTKLGELVSCPWCSGFYVAIGVFVALMLSPLWTTLLLFPMALRVIPGLLSR